MCAFHDCNCNVFGDMWWTDKCTYFSSIDGRILTNCAYIVNLHICRMERYVHSKLYLLKLTMAVDNFVLEQDI